MLAGKAELWNWKSEAAATERVYSDSDCSGHWRPRGFRRRRACCGSPPQSGRWRSTCEAVLAGKGGGGRFHNNRRFIRKGRTLTSHRERREDPRGRGCLSPSLNLCFLSVSIGCGPRGTCFRVNILSFVWFFFVTCCLFRLGRWNSGNHRNDESFCSGGESSIHQSLFGVRYLGNWVLHERGLHLSFNIFNIFGHSHASRCFRNRALGGRSILV